MTRIEQAVRQSLGEIIPEELGVDLVSAGTVTEIEEQEGRVRLVVHPGYPCASRLPALRREIEERVTPLLEGRELALELSVRIKPHRAQHDMPAMMQAANVIAVASGKGGVGKSTTAVNLALALHAEGAKVGLLDADIFGPSQPIMLGLPKGTRPETRDGNAFVPVMAHGIQTMSMGYLVTEQTPVVWRGPKASGAVTQMMQQTLWHDLDYLIVDLPPGTGDIQLTLAQKIPVAGAVVVTTPQDIALLDAVKGVEIGDGFQVVNQRGEEHRDEMTPEGFASNHAGGVLGGITSGQIVRASMALKPTSSITIPGRSINLRGEATEVVTKGRHDPCVGVRATPIAEAMLALVLMDHYLRHRGQNGDVTPPLAPIPGGF